jgi:hypothetical protein
MLLKQIQSRCSYGGNFHIWSLTTFQRCVVGWRVDNHHIWELKAAEILRFQDQMMGRAIQTIRVITVGDLSTRPNCHPHCIGTQSQSIPLKQNQTMLYLPDINLSFKFCVVCKPDLSTVYNLSILTKITSLSRCDSVVWQMFTNISENAMLPSHFDPADGDSVFLWNNSKYLPDYTVSHLRRQHSS